MEPHIEYARTSDGISVAYTSFGQGPPLIVMPGVPFSNFRGEWQVPQLREAYERLGSQMRVVMYDGRGTGHSQRDVTDVSLEAMVRDLEAVMAEAGLSNAGLLASWNACPASIAFAAAYPDRVNRLALYGGSARGWTAMRARETQALLSLIERDWDVFADMAAHAWTGWSSGDAGRLTADVFRAATTPMVARATLQAVSGVDVTRLVPTIVAPALVLHRLGTFQLAIDESRSLARLFPKGRLVVVEGKSSALFLEHADKVVGVLLAFFAGLEDLLPDDSEALGLRVAGVTAELTRRELEVLRLLAAGETNTAIGYRLGLTVHTVERHVANTYRKLDVRGRAEASAFAVRHGLD